MQHHAARARSGDDGARTDAVRGDNGGCGEAGRRDPVAGLAIDLDGTAVWTID